MSAERTETFAAAVKLPTFWPSSPRAWFVRVEAQFTSRKILADETKYEYVVASLPEEIILKILDELENPPAADKYTSLKQILISRFTESEERRLEQLLSGGDMGDQTPSDYYRSLEILAGTGTVIADANLLKKLWLRKLPAQLKIALTAIESGQEIKDLLIIADKIFDAENMNKSSISSVGDNTLISLQQQIVELKNELKEMRNSRSQYRSQNRTSRSNSNSSNKSQLCWYHLKFREKAQKCIKPCSFVSSSNKNSKN